MSDSREIYGCEHGRGPGQICPWCTGPSTPAPAESGGARKVIADFLEAEKPGSLAWAAAHRILLALHHAGYRVAPAGKPVTEYRPLLAREIIAAADEAYHNDTGPWGKVTDARVGEEYTPWNGMSGFHVAMRRPLSPLAEDANAKEEKKNA